MQFRNKLNAELQNARTLFCRNDNSLENETSNMSWTLNYKMPIGIEHRKKNSGKRNRDSTNDKLATVMNTKLIAPTRGACLNCKPFRMGATSNGDSFKVQRVATRPLRVGGHYEWVVPTLVGLFRIRGEERRRGGQKRVGSGISDDF